MEKLVVLYFIDLAYGSIGQGKVSISDLARWFRVSKPTVVRFCEQMVNEELITRHEISAKTGNGFLVKYAMTALGKQHLDNHFDSAYELYRIQVAKIMKAIIIDMRQTEEQKELTSAQRKAAAAEQKELL